MSAFDVFMTDTMTVWRTQDAPAAENENVTETQTVCIVADAQCHLAQNLPQLEKLLEHYAASAVMKLFFPADTDVKEGDTVEVVKNGRTAGPKQTYRFTCAKPAPALGACMEVVVYG